MGRVQVPIETKPEGYWYDTLLLFPSYADLIRECYPNQYFEIPGALILELPAPVEVTIIDD
jgi:hypothetical protein